MKYLERIFCEYNLFGELELFVDKPILNYVEAMEPCEVIKIPKDAALPYAETAVSDTLVESSKKNV